MTPANESHTLNHAPWTTIATVPSTRYLQHGSASRYTPLFHCSCADCRCPAMTRDGNPCVRCRNGEHQVQVRATLATRVFVWACVVFCAIVFAAVVAVHVGSV